MANQYGIDLGQMYSQVENIKSQRLANKSNQMDLDTKTRLEEERPAREAAALKRQNTLSTLRQQSAAGDSAAAQQLISLDPENGPKFMEAVYKADDRQLEAMKRSVDEMGNISSFVLQGKTPEEQAARYARARQSVSPEIKQKFPEQYDPNFMQLSLSKAMSMDKILENPKAVTVGDEDILFKNGFEQERAKNPTKQNAAANIGGDSGGGTTVTDENSMHKFIKEQFATKFIKDPATGLLTPTVLEPDQKKKVQGIFREAVEIYNNAKGSMSRAEATTQALNKYGFDIPEAPTATSGLPQFVQNSISAMEQMNQQPSQPAQQPTQQAPAAAPQPYAEGTRARNRSTGEVMIMQNGQWVPTTN